MKLKDQVVSVELAKELKEWGVTQESIWYWCRIQNDIRDHIDILRERDIREADEWYLVTKICSAITVAELGEMLPTFYTSFRAAGQWACDDELDKNQNIRFTSNTEADARAKMLLYLIKEKIIKVGEVGK